ncbi:primosomal protein N' [candidate division GN15 bacterium]|nr:primosomal protein N' [candidate division GN15 bacterium]
MASPQPISRHRVKVAVSGPLRRTFTYHLPTELGPLEPGQRVLVEFGRKRRVGFYLDRGASDPGVATKPVLQALDRRSYFPPDLLKTCLWMADYYFANPADVLASALPPALKSTRRAKLVWATDPVDLPVELRSVAKPGKQLTPKSQAKIESAGLTTAKLTAGGVLVEDWPEAGGSSRKVLRGYRASRPEKWPEFFGRRAFEAEPFADIRPRNRLKEDGWNDSAVRAAVQAGLLEPVETDRPDNILSFVAGREGVRELPLTDEQQSAYDRMAAALDKGFKGYLIHGITGSGKTLVYCHLARQVMERGKTVLVLTPEIALSGATLAYFRGFFGDRVTVIHSAMTPRERQESWRGVIDGKYRIVVGPRSAVFAPLSNLGLVIVDEEHDGSYKQDDPAPRFNGRDTAVMRAKIADCPVLLGSASPSVESYYNAREGRYELLELTSRPAGARLPSVRVVDLRRERLHGDQPYLSLPMKKAVDARLERQEQSILFLNRRGYSPQIKCVECGHVPTCPECRIKLTYHRAGDRLTCHYCGYVRYGYAGCEKCGQSDFQYPGVGTQKVEEHIAQLFPGAKVMRFDSDSASGRRSAHDLLHEFAAGDYDLLLGTQMVTKGLDLPGVSLVGVLSADQGLDFPDFRANEKTFARLLQVAGRSGRGVNPGEVVIQTNYPEHEVIDDAARQDYKSFFDREIESRRDFAYPPFARLARFVFSSRDEGMLLDAVSAFSSELERRAAKGGVQISRMGPAPCTIALLRGSHRQHLIVRTRDTVRLGRLLTSWEYEKARFGLPSKVRVAVDIDPDDMM